MKTSPIYIFENDTSVGIFEVPISSFLMVRETGTDNLPKLFTKKSNFSLTAISTIADFLANTNLYEAFVIENLSELEKITEGTNTGWRILDRDPNNFCDIGENAVDFSDSTFPSTTNGAKGDNSFAIGQNTSASGDASFASGIGTIANGDTAVAFGKYNIGGGINIFEIGDGTDAITRSNVFAVDGTCGLVFTSKVTNGDIDGPSATGKVLITREYLENFMSAANTLNRLGDVIVTPPTVMAVYTANTLYKVDSFISVSSGFPVITTNYVCIVEYTSGPGGGLADFNNDLANGYWTKAVAKVSTNHLLISDINGNWTNQEDIDYGTYP